MRTIGSIALTLGPPVALAAAIQAARRGIDHATSVLAVGISALEVIALLLVLTGAIR